MKKNVLLSLLVFVFVMLNATQQWVVGEVFTQTW